MTGEVGQDWELLQNDWKTPEEEKTRDKQSAITVLSPSPKVLQLLFNLESPIASLTYVP